MTQQEIDVESVESHGGSLSEKSARVYIDFPIRPLLQDSLKKGHPARTTQ
jgi:hypothetical protein